MGLPELTLTADCGRVGVAGAGQYRNDAEDSGKRRGT